MNDYDDDPIDGNFYNLTCPYCKETVDEVWEYGLILNQEDDQDSMQCPHCEKDFIVTRQYADIGLTSQQMYDGFVTAADDYRIHVKRCEEQLDRHFLSEICNDGPFKSYYLKRPGSSRMMSTCIIFTPEGIVITGDFCPNYGVVSVGGYGEGWFSNALSSCYLAEKFMTVDQYSTGHAQLVAIQRRFSIAHKELHTTEMAYD
jgi:hypothetical protein